MLSSRRIAVTIVAGLLTMDVGYAIAQQTVITEITLDPGPTGVSSVHRTAEGKTIYRATATSGSLALSCSGSATAIDPFGEYPPSSMQAVLEAITPSGRRVIRTWNSSGSSISWSEWITAEGEGEWGCQISGTAYFGVGGELSAGFSDASKVKGAAYQGQYSFGMLDREDGDWIYNAFECSHACQLPQYPIRAYIGAPPPYLAEVGITFVHQRWRICTGLTSFFAAAPPGCIAPTAVAATQPLACASPEPGLFRGISHDFAPTSRGDGDGDGDQGSLLQVLWRANSR